MLHENILIRNQQFLCMENSQWNYQKKHLHWKSDQKLLHWNFKHKKRCAVAHSNDYVRTKLNELLYINDQSGISDNETLYQKLSAKVIILILLKGYVKTGVSI